jgi:hypothetical protein
MIIPVVLFIIVFGTLIIYMFHRINYQFKKPSKRENNKKPHKTDIVGIYKDISIKPYGCFSSLDEKFFQKKLKNGVPHSGMIISDSNQDHDIRELINNIIDIGFDQYGYHLINKYKRDYSGMNIKEIGILAKLAGYSYISVYKLNEGTRGKIYLSYSPPMNKQLDYDASQEESAKHLTKSDLPKHTLTPELDKYTNEEEKAPGKELSCGYTCLTSGKQLTHKENGIKRHYMCGSVGYPNIKTPTRFAVYELIES